MSDPLVSQVIDDDGVQRWVAAGGPSDTDTPDELTKPAPVAEPADPDDPAADQPARLVAQEVPGAAADAADGDGPDPGSGKRRP